MPSSELSLAAHRRQFVLASAPVLPEPGWHSLAVSKDCHFSHQPDLPVRRMDRDGRQMTVFGHGLAAMAEPAGSDLAESLAGRFGWIDWPYLYPDACALFPVYYGNAPNGPMITSSLALAGRITGATTSERQISWEGLNWTPPPGTPVTGFRKLMRDQRLHIPTATPEHIDRALRPAASVEQARDNMASDLTGIAGALRDRPGTTYLALTAGLDSRTLLAALIAADARFECVTQTFDGVNPNDIEVAGRIARHLGLKHHVIGPEIRDEGLTRIWREHSAETYSDADNVHLLPQNQYRFLGAGDVLVRGGCFELGRRFYAARLVGLDLGNVTGAALWSRFEAGAPSPQAATALDEWLDWRRRHDNGLDLVDAFYLDQRAGGWLSAVEHGLDMMPGLSMPAANCGRILSALITPSVADREAGRLQRETIRQLAPGLLRFPINPTSLGDRATKLLRRTRSSLTRRLKQVLPADLVQRLRGH